jgi:MoaA/NifB/PqqE/SkfB family radical SAM enzyme
VRLNLSILYRGTLASCNYACSYCPFAKHWESEAELCEDREGLQRFCDWVTHRADDEYRIFFTPWGEALVRKWYRDAIVHLSRLRHVKKVAVQTNLSCDLEWLQASNTAKLGFWCTFHPTQTTLPAFLEQCSRLQELMASYSVGCVGLREHLPAIQELKRRLPDDVYLWINAYKMESKYYDEQLLEILEAIDPLFPINNAQHQSLGRACRSGHTVVAVDSRGDIRRCHFVDHVIGNIYQHGFEECLTQRTCPNFQCECHIGYVHLEHLNLDYIFGDALLERIAQLPNRLSL